MNNLQLIKEAQSLMSSIFEVDYEGEKDKINPNKAEKKDKVDVVSVADELFPAGGTAKQQYNQKIINKINDMIEGKATLEDLIQLVRQKSAAKKAIATHECLDNAVELLEEMINEVSKKFINKRLQNAAAKFQKLEDEETKLEQENAPKEEIEKATTKKVKYGHKAFPAIDRITQKAVDRPEEDN